jgi:phosphoribosylformimino-5-aminoimidazole carboxamide ribotide isomerase
MRVIPVLDLQAGRIVRGIAGQRDAYRPVVSVLTPSSDPVDVAEALGARFGFDTFYLADLDAVRSLTPPCVEVYAALRRLGIRLWVDAGLHDAGDADPLVRAGVHGIVAGLETLRGPGTLAELFWMRDRDSILFSLDLKDGRPLGDLSRWRQADVLGIARQAVDLGVTRILLLDLGRVGTGHGTGTEELCTALTTEYPDVEIWAGGGVRGPEDLRRLSSTGIDTALVASALHDGRIQPEHLHGL